MLEQISVLDWSIINFFKLNTTNMLLNKVMIFFTILGNVGGIWILISLFLLMKKRHRSLGFMLLIGMVIVAGIGNGLIKNLIGRPRPFIVDPSISLLIKEPSDYSFPSGHTFSSFVSATLIYIYNKKWGVWAIILACIISFSRIYLLVHFPSDVLAGLILGVFFGILISKFFAKHYKEF